MIGGLGPGLEQVISDSTGRGGPGDLTAELLAEPVWSEEMLASAGIPVHEAPFLTVGGGLGSFAMVDYLRIAGVPADRIKVLSNIGVPWKTYEYLTRVSQIPDDFRIRSDASSRPDNIWGFPSYALSEAWQDKTLSPLWNVLAEPVFADYWTPRRATVLAGLQREAARIGWEAMVARGAVRMVRRRAGGGYYTILTPDKGTSATKRVAYWSRYVHLAIGYPGLRYLPDLQDYRERHQDYERVVAAYEPHEHVYEALKGRPGTVVIRGGGIVASRVLERLFDDRRRYGLHTNVIQVFRNYVDGAHGPSPWMRRKGGDGWAYQGFNFPKAAWGGQLSARLRKLEGEDRRQLYELIGGTSTPWRRGWQRQLADGRAGGYYRGLQGVVEKVEPSPDGKRVVSHVKGRDREDAELIEADFIIDCTGLEADISKHRVLADLLEHGGASRNPLGRLEVGRNFEVTGTANGGGALYASGAATLGGYFAAVDSFLGLQFAAQAIGDDLARRGWCRKMGPARSVAQWLKWMSNSPV